jgi:hypothetical protein
MTKLFSIFLSFIFLSSFAFFSLPVFAQDQELNYALEITDLKFENDEFLIYFESNFSPKENKLFYIFDFKNPEIEQNSMVYIGSSPFKINKNNTPIDDFNICASPLKANLEIVKEASICKTFDLKNI